MKSRTRAMCMGFDLCEKLSCRHGICYTEYLVFQEKMDTETARFIYRYCQTLINMSQVNVINDPDDHILIKIDSDSEHITSDSPAFSSFILSKLSKLNGFTLSVDVRITIMDYEVDILDDDYDIFYEDGMRGYLDMIKCFEKFTYKQASYYICSGEVEYVKIEDGRSYIDEEIFDVGERNISECNKLSKWWNWDTFSVYVEGLSYTEYRDVADKLHDLIRIHTDNIAEYYDELWEEEPWNISLNEQWCFENISKLEAFIKDFNEVFSSISDKCELFADGIWEVRNKYALLILNVVNNKLTYDVCKY